MKSSEATCYLELLLKAGFPETVYVGDGPNEPEFNWDYQMAFSVRDDGQVCPRSRNISVCHRGIELADAIRKLGLILPVSTRGYFTIVVGSTYDEESVSVHFRPGELRYRPDELANRALGKALDRDLKIREADERDRAAYEADWDLDDDFRSTKGKESGW